jgi:hypothetical protein
VITLILRKLCVQDKISLFDCNPTTIIERNPALRPYLVVSFCFSPYLTPPKKSYMEPECGKAGQLYLTPCRAEEDMRTGGFFILFWRTPPPGDPWGAPTDLRGGTWYNRGNRVGANCEIISGPADIFHTSMDSTLVSGRISTYFSHSYAIAPFITPPFFSPLKSLASHPTFLCLIPVVGKLLLKSSWVTLLQLLVKVTRYF